MVVSDVTSVKVKGHLAPVEPGREDGRMERIVFSDGVVASAAEAGSSMR